MSSITTPEAELRSPVLLSGVADGTTDRIAAQFAAYRTFANRTGILRQNGETPKPETSIFSPDLKVEIPNTPTLHFTGTNSELLSVLERAQIAVTRGARGENNTRGPVLIDSEGCVTITDARLRPTLTLSCVETRLTQPLKVKAVGPTAL